MPADGHNEQLLMAVGRLEGRLLQLDTIQAAILEIKTSQGKAAEAFAAHQRESDGRDGRIKGLEGDLAELRQEVAGMRQVVGMSRAVKALFAGLLALLGVGNLPELVDLLRQVGGWFH